MPLNELLDRLEKHLIDPNRGLPEEVFLFLTRITPMVNVDLLIKNTDGQTLLTWRDDGFWPPGWHIPGGVIRFKESAATRIREVARLELAATVHHDPRPLGIFEFIHPTRQTRGHFVSLLFACTLLTPPAAERRADPETPLPGQWAWHSTCPHNLLEVHRPYARFIDSSFSRCQALEWDQSPPSGGKHPHDHETDISHS